MLGLISRNLHILISWHGTHLNLIWCTYLQILYFLVSSGNDNFICKYCKNLMVQRPGRKNLKELYSFLYTLLIEKHSLCDLFCCILKVTLHVWQKVGFRWISSFTLKKSISQAANTQNTVGSWLAVS